MLSHLLLSSLLLLAPTLSSAAPSPSGPAQCVTFDAGWNLLAFNYNGKDYNAGADLSSTTAAVDITAANRPPFDVSSSSPLCFLSKFTNSIYVLNADATDRSSVYIYDATAKSWSKQQTSNAPASYDPSQFGAILDHDTNVFYVLSNGEMFSLDMALLKAATSETIPWNLVQEPQLSPDGVTESYEPVMAIARNHIHFLGVPGLEAGQDRIFVIHYSYLQPEVQSYGDFPNSHGKVTSFFKDEGVQTDYAYIPDDGSNTYVVNVVSNTTVRIPGPTTKDPYAMYAASPNTLVQLASTGGAVSWIGYDQSNRQGTSWKSLTILPEATAAGAGASTTNRNATTGGNKTSTTGNGTVNVEPEAADGAAVEHAKPIILATVLAMTFTGVVAFAL